MTTFDEVARLRLVAQRLAGPPAADAAAAVRHLTAVQAQDFPGAVTSVALRTTDRLREGVAAALDAGRVVRSWPMRGTLHLVAAEDLPWLLDLLGPRMLAAAAGRRAQLGLDEATYARARGVTEATLSGGRGLRRRELMGAWAAAGIPVEGQRGPHLLGQLAQTGVVCQGPLDGAEQRYVLIDEWIRHPRRLAREEALAELAERYFAGHGPATVRDLARWAGLTLGDARAGLLTARPHLAALDVEGVEHLMSPATPDRLAACREQTDTLFLLPGFDEFVLGYGDRRAVLDAAFSDRIVPGGNGMFRPTVVHRGRIVGTWEWSGSGAGRTATATPFGTFPDEVTAAFPAAAAALP